jgi:hypothetical protein
MNKKLLGIVIATLAIAMLITPALAAPAQKINFVVKTIPLNPQPTQGDDYVRFTSEGGIMHCRNQIGASIAKLWLSSDASGLPTYQGTGMSEVMWTLNQELTGPAVYKLTWTFSEGTFEGNLICTMTAVSPTAPAILSEIHGVLHGTGIFEGQTMRIEDGARPLGQPLTVTGTIIIP